LSFDWAIGDVFYSMPISDNVTVHQESGKPWNLVVDAVYDSLSLPRVFNILVVIGGPLSDESSPLAIWQLLKYGYIVTVSPCPDGRVAANFGFAYNMTCPGFLDDGSGGFFVTFLDKSSLSAAISGALLSDSPYMKALSSTNGRPNRAYLEAAATLGRRLKERFGELIVVMPPLAPGFEAAVLQRAESREQLLTFKQEVTAWSNQEGITVIDAGAAEKFGCLAEDFFDLHHAK